MTEGLLKAAEKYSLVSKPAKKDAPVRKKRRDKVKKPDIRIIGIDPGLASTGWGVVDLSNGMPKYIAHGCIETSAEESGPERLAHIYQSFLKVLRKYKPTEAAMEALYFGRNTSSAMPVAEARGVLLMSLGSRGLPVRELAPNSIKKAVTGAAKASKKQVQEMVRLILDLKETPKPDHAADALGAAIYVAHNSSNV